MSHVKINDADIVANFGAIDFVLRSQRSMNGLTLSLEIKLLTADPPVPEEIEGLLASKITLPDAMIAFWATTRVSAVTEGEYIRLQCRDVLLRDIDAVGDMRTFEEYVQEASQDSGLPLVIRVENIGYDAQNQQVTANNGYDSSETE